MKRSDNEIFREAIDTFGVDSRINKAIEECGELIVALSRPINRRNLLNIAGEITDVRIMLDQLEMMFDVNTDRARKLKIKKLVSQIQRIREGRA